jgi:hypothetical protein
VFSGRRRGFLPITIATAVGNYAPNASDDAQSERGMHGIRYLPSTPPVGNGHRSGLAADHLFTRLHPAGAGPACAAENEQGRGQNTHEPMHGYLGSRGADVEGGMEETCKRTIKENPGLYNKAF